MREAFQFADTEVVAGTRRLIDLPVALLSNHSPINVPVHVVHGRRSGPTLFVSAAIHGDEVIGVEVIRRLLRTKALSNLRGTLLCVPIVNAFGFVSQTRYLPNQAGRDLNRVFPGQLKGTLAAQVAALFMTEIVQRSDYGIDLHTGAVNRPNMPQLRGDFTKPELREISTAFGAPVVLQSNLREGSLRAAARDVGVDVLLYEAGEALRLDEIGVRVGVKGILNVMRHLGMLAGTNKVTVQPVFSKSSRWVRAPEAGLFRAFKALGASVQKGDTLGAVANPYEEVEVPVIAPFDGIIIGRTNTAGMNRGDALFHIAAVSKPGRAEGKIDKITEDIAGEAIFDEDEIM